MKSIKLKKLWNSLHSSYWFLPTVMAVISAVLALILLRLDRMGEVSFDGWPLIYTGGVDGARGLLSAMAGSMITVTATAFSITIVALQLAASNFGPRILRNFMQDTGNQIVLGTFISTFIYCLLVLRTIRGEEYDFFVPQLSTTVGIILSIVSIGVLIYFIHHASTIIQASHIISDVHRDLEQAIARLFPEKIGQSIPNPYSGSEAIPSDFDTVACPILSQSSGYLQAIENEKLMKIACQQNLLLQIKFHPGKYIIEGAHLVLVYPGERVTPHLVAQFNQAFILGRERTEQQDIGFPIDQLVEIALRAISPAVNDPFTAVRCIDRLSWGLSRLAQRNFPSPYRFDDDHNLRVIAKPVTFEQLADHAFNPIRQYARSDTTVIMHLLDAIAIIASCTYRPKDQIVLRRHADKIYRSSQEGLSEEDDRNDVEERYLNVIKLLEQRSWTLQ